MAARINLFLDTSALFAAIWSAQGGGRQLLKLGEAGAVDLWASSQVLTELENALRRKYPEWLGLLALLLERSRLQVTLPPSEAAIAQCGALTAYAPDAHVLAAALTAGADYFVTLDKQHFLENSAVLTAGLLPMGTPGDCLAWLRVQFQQL